MSRRRAVVLGFTLVLAGIGIWMLAHGNRDMDTLALLASGCALGTLYAFGITLPKELTDSTLWRLFGPHVMSEDHPANRRTRLYLGILLAAIIAVSCLSWALLR